MSRLTRMVGDKIQVSHRLGSGMVRQYRRARLAAVSVLLAAILVPDQVDRRMRDYTDLAFTGEVARRRSIRDSLNPVREAFRRSRPAEKPPSHPNTGRN